MLLNNKRKLTESDLKDLPQSRKEAKEVGSTRYFTGEPCKLGHVTFKYTGNSQCHTCGYLRNKEEADETARKRRVGKQWAGDYLGSKCQHCQDTFNHLAVYEAHHLDAEKKDENINNFQQTNLENFKKIAILELDKCILLCANCHRIEHSDPNSEFNKKHKNMLTRPQRSL